jgi:hypothetical protein
MSRPAVNETMRLGNSSHGRGLLDYRDYRASTSWQDVTFEDERDKKPWKKVALAVFLCFAGAVMLTTGIVLWYKGPDQGSCEFAQSWGSSISNSKLHCMKTQVCSGQPAGAQMLPYHPSLLLSGIQQTLPILCLPWCRSPAAALGLLLVNLSLTSSSCTSPNIHSYLRFSVSFFGVC